MLWIFKWKRYVYIDICFFLPILYIYISFLRLCCIDQLPFCGHFLLRLNLRLVVEFMRFFCFCLPKFVFSSLSPFLCFAIFCQQFTTFFWYSCFFFFEFYNTFSWPARGIQRITEHARRIKRRWNMIYENAQSSAGWEWICSTALKVAT